jgi:hypothetical protein
MTKPDQTPQNNDAFLNSLKTKGLPKADSGIDTAKRKQLIYLALFGTLMCALFIWWIFRKPAPKALIKNALITKEDKVISDARQYRMQENDPTKGIPFEDNFGASTVPQKPAFTGEPVSNQVPVESDGLTEKSEGEQISDHGSQPNSRVVNHNQSSGNSDNESPGRSRPHSNAPYEPAEYRPSRELQMRLSKSYSDVMVFLDSRQVLERPSDYKTMEPNPTAALDSQYKSLTDGQPNGFGAGSINHIAAGTELRGYTNEALNTDYPSVIKGTLTSPPALRGATVLISYRLLEERASATVEKIIIPARSALIKPSEIAIQSVVKDGLPGLDGDVNHHWGPQIAAGIINGGLTAGALYYASSHGNNNDLGTAVLLAPAIEKGLEGATKPINYLGRERNITVTVDAGKEFTVLVTQGFDIP